MHFVSYLLILFTASSALAVNSVKLTSHALDTSKGYPIKGMQLVLYKFETGQWIDIHQGATNDDGRYEVIPKDGNRISAGQFKLHFKVEQYFESQGQDTIFPFIEIAFFIKENITSLHIPIILSPFGYYTYRGS